MHILTLQLSYISCTVDMYINSELFWEDEKNGT